MDLIELIDRIADIRRNIHVGTLLGEPLPATLLAFPMAHRRALLSPALDNPFHRGNVTTKIMGMPFVLDDTLPDDVIEVRDPSTGRSRRFNIHTGRPVEVAPPPAAPGIDRALLTDMGFKPGTGTWPEGETWVYDGMFWASFSSPRRVITHDSQINLTTATRAEFFAKFHAAIVENIINDESYTGCGCCS